MNLFGKISVVIWIVLFIAAAIMFDWFGSRNAATSLLESTQIAVEKLEETGDQVKEAIDIVTEDSEPVKEAIEKVTE